MAPTQAKSLGRGYFHQIVHGAKSPSHQYIILDRNGHIGYVLQNFAQISTTIFCNLGNFVLTKIPQIILFHEKKTAQKEGTTHESTYNMSI